MKKTSVRWPFNLLIETIVTMLLSKFDCIILIEGNRGLGKSTLAYEIAKKIENKITSLRRKEIGLDFNSYRFNAERDLLYKRKEVLDFFIKKRSIGIADEMINVSFSRDFWQNEQKKLIKMINMNRDHFNLFIACIPRFQTLDNQIKNLAKIRITVVRRGVAIIQTPNRTIYSTDVWDSRVNESIEREWLKKRVSNPHYARLSTFRGFLFFPKLGDEEEIEYQRIKDDKRNQIHIEETTLEDAKTRPITAFSELMRRFENSGIKNQEILEGYAISMNITLDSLKNKIRGKLKYDGKNTKLTDYFWEDIQKLHPEKSQTRKLKGLIESIG